MPGKFVNTSQPPALCYDASKCLQARDSLPMRGQAFETENPPEIRIGKLSFRDAANASILALAPYSFGLGHAFEFRLYS